MKKIITFLMLIFFIPAYASAMEITSPFGWRTHPVFGTTKFHSGIDVGADYGDNVPAAMGGIVSFADYCNGYGKQVIIDHPDGSQTSYAHNQDLCVVQGQTVTEGQIVALAGSTGYSTGPHVHIEHLVGGEPVDPTQLLQAHGWSLTYGGSPAVVNGDFANSDYDDMPWKFGDFYNVATEVKKILETFADVCQKGLAFILGDAMTLLKYLLIIDFAVSALLFIISDTDKDFIRFFFNKFIKYGFIVFLLTNWKEFLNVFMLDSFTNIAMMAGNSGAAGAAVSDNISDPSKIIQKGFSLVTPVFTYLTQYSGIHLIVNIHNVFLAMFIGFSIIACFAWVGIQFFLAYLEFYIIAMLTVIMAPFSVIKQMKFLGEKSIGSVLAVGIKLMLMTIVVALIVSTISKDMKLGVYDHVVYLRVLLGSLTMAFLASRIPRNLTNLLTGNPKF